jgi:ERCC4-type nuclease
MHEDYKDRYESLLNAIHKAVEGTGCITAFELRLAFDHLRDILQHKHNDIWTARRVGKAVTEKMYAINYTPTDAEQMEFVWDSTSEKSDV